MIMLKKILFVGCLYQSNNAHEPFLGYAQACQKTIETSKRLFPNSSFEIHTDESLDKEMVKLLSHVARLVQHQYPIQQKSFPFSLNSTAQTRRYNVSQLTKCMRLNVLFSKEWAKQHYDYCIVLDVHDDFKKTATLIEHYLNEMSEAQHYLITQWQSTEADCPYDPVVTKKTHCHFDAGLVIAKKAFPSRDDLSFEEFCLARVMRAPTKLIKGVEEMLIDEYLKSQSFYTHHEAEILKLKHACKVDNLFYEPSTAMKTKINQTNQKNEKILVKAHLAHSIQTNKKMGNVNEIYICTQIPSSFFQRKRTRDNDSGLSRENKRHQLA